MNREGKIAKFRKHTQRAAISFSGVCGSLGTIWTSLVALGSWQREADHQPWLYGNTRARS